MGDGAAKQSHQRSHKALIEKDKAAEDREALLVLEQEEEGACLDARTAEAVCHQSMVSSKEEQRSLSEMTGNLYSSVFGYLANEQIFSHLGPPLLQRAGRHYEWSKSTSLVCVVLGATLWLALFDLEQTAEHVGPTHPWRLSQQISGTLVSGRYQETSNNKEEVKRCQYPDELGKEESIK
ncbi:hypothetical protein llap_5779 [Limosa lapponica baueri]|uniref:Uncharacterized protein n=1 Tax=Limosa lapponica baueri TaxID=1758121 RepID=A0A2I0UD00_LIMLA|nr:hypothetical protein llap_5779 [Limosa lapponica baueri]